MTARKESASLPYRADIDGLRALAILLVVGFHLFPEVVKGGFIGVDIFFVISGYLISTIILGQLDKGRFSFLQFYIHRIRRIFPALLLVLATCFTAGWFLLLTGEYMQLGKHIFGSAFFISNMVLWREAGYFDPAAETKPLLHLWSLGIEEQFYIVWPILLSLARNYRRRLFSAMLVVALASFALNVARIHIDPNGTFYFPITRCWELLAGCLLAYAVLHKHTLPPATKNAAATIGLLLIVLATALLNSKSAFPGIWAMLPVMGAVLLIWSGPNAWINRTLLSQKIMVWFGLISFPLYLWHWPLVSFATILGGEFPPLSTRIAITLTSIVLAWATYRLIEKPLRSHQLSTAKAGILLFALLSFGAAGWYIYRHDGLQFRPIFESEKFVLQNLQSDLDIRAAYPLESCLGDSRIIGGAKEFCGRFNSAGKGKLIVLWGDSHAYAWQPAFFQLAKEEGFRLVVFSHSGCPPLLHVRRSDGQPTGQGSANACALNLGEDVVASIHNLHPEQIFVMARWSVYAHGLIKGGILQKATHFITTSPKGEADIATSRAALQSQIAPTLDALLAISPNLILFKNPPILSRHIGPGYIRDPRHFEPSFAGHERFEAFNDALLETAAAGKPIRFFDPAPFLCTEKCRAASDATLLYTDDNHMSAQGALLFKDKIAALIHGSPVPDAPIRP